MKKGILHVSHGFLEQQFKLHGREVSLERKDIERFARLPEGTRVLGVMEDFERDQVKIKVTGRDELPLVREGEFIPHVDLSPDGSRFIGG